MTIVILLRLNLKGHISLIIIIIPFINLLFLYLFVYHLLCESLSFLSVFVLLVLLFFIRLHWFHVTSVTIGINKLVAIPAHYLPTIMYVRSSYSIYTVFLHFLHCKMFDTLTDLLWWADNDWQHNIRLRREFCCIFRTLTYYERTKMHPLLQRWSSLLSTTLLTIKTPVVSSEKA